ncbi:hypothetical protein BKA64DRAFT_133112 [Cadophora sp. MPI-SDFR-AT-0126]|nr:hypothetical protein BKA64DRAFT_133112 [Leotiomycetes sp. MPI-SDFR-AT-0126]
MKSTPTPLFHPSHQRSPSSTSTTYSQQPPTHLTTPETPTSTAYPSSNPSSTFQLPPSPKRHSKFKPSTYNQSHKHKPAYSSILSPKHQSSSFTFTFSSLNPFRIRSTSTPQWSWSSSQCKTWLTAVLVDCCGRDRESARVTAENVFKTGGNGPGLYLMGRETWGRFLGERDGEVVWGVLGRCRGRVKGKKGGW